MKKKKLYDNMIHTCKYNAVTVFFIGTYDRVPIHTAQCKRGNI